MQLRGRRAAQPVRGHEGARERVLPKVRLQVREPEHHHHQGCRDADDVGVVDADPLHDLPAMSGAAAEQEKGSVPAPNQRGGTV